MIYCILNDQLGNVTFTIIVIIYALLVMLHSFLVHYNIRTFSHLVNYVIDDDILRFF